MNHSGSEFLTERVWDTFATHSRSFATPASRPDAMLDVIRKWLSKPLASPDGGRAGDGPPAATIVLYARVAAAKGPDAANADTRQTGGGEAVGGHEPRTVVRPGPAALQVSGDVPRQTLPGRMRKPSPDPAARRWRSRVLRSDLRDLGLVPRELAEQWRRAGIETGGDAARCEPHEVIGRLGGTERERRQLVVVRRCVRMAATVDAMRPIDAMLLIRIHRRSVRRLAGESAAVVRRDLERFAFSTPGRRLLRGRPLPDSAKIAGWIDRCRSRDRQVA